MSTSEGDDALVGTVTGESPAGGAVRGAGLAIGGMTCASCAARIQKKLNKLDGVTAAVNFATETARVTYPGTVSPGELISVVEQAGYTAAVPVPPEAATGEQDDAGEADALRVRLLASLA